MDRRFFMMGSILGGLAVAIGAFGAHGLEKIVTPEALETWETAVRYQMYHALALFVVSWAINRWPNQEKWFRVGGWMFLSGTMLFSGSLYLLVISGLNQLGAVTPVGGVILVSGWFCLFLATIRK